MTSALFFVAAAILLSPGDVGTSWQVDPRVMIILERYGAILDNVVQRLDDLESRSGQSPEQRDTALQSVQKDICELREEVKRLPKALGSLDQRLDQLAERIKKVLAREQEAENLAKMVQAIQREIRQLCDEVKKLKEGQRGVEQQSKASAGTPNETPQSATQTALPSPARSRT